MDQASDGIFLSDGVGVYLDVNRRGCEMLGMTRDELVGKSVRDVCDPDDLRRRPLAIDKIITGVPFFSERRMRRKDGSLFIAELSTTRLDDGRYLSIARDGTARRENEQRLQRAEASFRNMLDILPDAVLVHRDGRIVYLNATAARYFRVEKPDVMLGTPVIEIVHPDDRPAVIARIRKMTETSSAVDMLPERILRRDGTCFDAEVAAIPLIFDGEPAILAAARDITDRVRLQAQLVQSERLATVGMLAAGVAHEVNNPLSYVLLNLERLSEALASPSPDIEALRANTRDAIDGARRVQKIVRELKTFARDDRSDATPISVNRAVEAALQLAAPELRFRAKTVRALSELPPVRANEGRLAQVFLNLLVNAAHAIAEGDPETQSVTVKTWVDGEEVRASVHDTGHGIAPELLPRLFEPFFTTKAAGMGSGLGLAICQSIVSDYGGRIEVESAPGDGSTFTVVLPVCHDGVAAPLESARASVPAPRPVGVSRPHLLLVDDEPNVRGVLQALLAPRFEVTAVGSGREALDLLRGGRPVDLLLCDILMPEVSGVDLYEEIERNHVALARRVVFMTGGAFTARARDLLDRVPGRWIEKPFEFDRLLGLLEGVLVSA